MSDNKNAKTISFQGSRALGLSIGLACSIPIAAAPAMANNGNHEPRERNTPRQMRLQQLQQSPAQDNGSSRRAERRNSNFTIQPVFTGANFNLNSGRANFTAGNLGTFQNLTIDVGGKERVVTLESKLTAGEIVAAQQVLDTGKQSIQLKANGAAVGGTISLDNSILTNLDKTVGGSIESLTVARGVQVIDNTSGLSLSGTLRNYGTIFTANEVAGGSDTISANTIHVGRGGSIESYTGTDLYAADPILNASKALINNGNISSLGNLTINAPVVSNVADGGGTATIAAANNVNINTQNLVNDGVINAAGNINVGSNAGLAVNGDGGTFQAGNNVNFTTEGGDISLNGGDLLSQQVNFNAGTNGKVDVWMDDATGIVNAKGCIIHLNADTDNLNVGTVDAYGDPIITNTGNIAISAAITPTNGAPLTLIAGGNIITNAGNTGLVTASAVADGGDLTLIAGAAFKQVGNNIAVSKKSKTGGLIDLTGGNGGSGAITAIDTGSGPGFVGGDVQMIAFAGKAVGTGSITLPTGVAIDTTGGNDDGNVLIIGSVKAGTAITGGAISAGNVSINAAAPTAIGKGVVQFDGTTGQQVSGSFGIKSAAKSDIVLNGAIGATGDLNLTTGGNLTVNNTIVSILEGSAMNIKAGTLGVTAAGSILSPDKGVATANILGATTIDGTIMVGTLNLTTSQLTINSTGKVADAFENIFSKGVITVDGELGRNPFALDPTRLTTTFNTVTTAANFLIGANNNNAVVAGNGTINALAFNNKGTAKGNITFNASGKSGILFDNFGTVDGTAVTVNAGKGAIVNETGAILQATQQTNDKDVPTLTLITTFLTNNGHIEAVGEQKQTFGTLKIQSLGDLTIAGVDNGFFVDFSSTVELKAAGDIVVGGIVNNVNSNPFSAFNTGLGGFKVEADGEFQSTMPGVQVKADGKGNRGEISITAANVVYNGVGAAPNFFLNATGDGNALSVNKKPIELILSDKKAGIIIGNNPGNYSVTITGFDPKSTSTFTTPNLLSIDMASFVINNTSLNLTGTSNFLLNGNLIGGENVTITTASKKDFVVGGATDNGVTGLNAGEGISALKHLTINSPGNFVLNAGTLLRDFGGEPGDKTLLVGKSLLINAGADVAGRELQFDPGLNTKTSYTNLNPNGAISSGGLTIKAAGILTLSNDNNQAQTVISVGNQRRENLGLMGGGAIEITATQLKFSPEGILFNAFASLPGSPNGGDVDITLSSSKVVKVGNGKGEIRANVTALPGFEAPSGSGGFKLTNTGPITATEIVTGNPSINLGGPNAEGRLSFNSTTSTVKLTNITGFSGNLLNIASGSTTPMLLNNAGKNGITDANADIGGGNLSFSNIGSLVTNGVLLSGVEYNFTSTSDINFSDNLGFLVGFNGPPSNEGGVIRVTAPSLKFNNQFGLALIALGGTATGGSITINTTSALDASEELRIAAPGVGNALSLDVGFTQGVGGSINVQTGGALKVNGAGLNFGNNPLSAKGSSLTLQSRQPTDTTAGSPLLFENTTDPFLAGLAYGSVTLTSGSSTPFKLNGANSNNGNGFVDGNLRAGTITINPLSGTGIIDATGYALVANNLILNADTINFDNQIISVNPDSILVGSGNNTGVGGQITISATDFNFSNAGGVLLQALGDPANPGSLGGTINVAGTGTNNVEIGANAFSFDVRDTGGGATQIAGSVIVKSAKDLVVDASALTYGTNDGGLLDLTAAGNMLISNISSLNGSKLNSATFTTTGTINGAGVFQFGSATDNGFTDVNPTFIANSVSINTSGKDAGIDTSTGTIQANLLTLLTTGNVNIASGGTLGVVANATTGVGGTLSITAVGITQSGGAAGYTLAAPGSTGAGGIIVVNLTGSNPLVIGAGGLSADISNGLNQAGGSLVITSGGSIQADISALDVGSNFGGSGPNVSINANGVLAVNNLSLISNIGLGGGQFSTVIVNGTPTAGDISTFTVTNAALPNGFIKLTYTEQAGDTAETIALAFTQLINSNSALQNIGVTATTTGNTISLRSTTNGTTYSDTTDPDGNLEIDLATSSGGLTLTSRTSQAFVLGGAAAGTNGIQDNNLNLDIANITIGNSGNITTATIGGGVRAGGTDVLTVIDPKLPLGSVELSYVIQDGDTRESVAQALATLVNNNASLQSIGVIASTSGSVITLTSASANTSYTSEAAKGAKIDLVTSSQGGDIVNGNLVSLTGASTISATLNSTGNIGSSLAPILLQGAPGSINTNAGIDAFIVSTQGATSTNLNAGRNLFATFTGGNVLGVSGNAGSFNLIYNNANALNNNTVRLTGVTTTRGDLTVASNAQTLEVAGSLTSGFGNIVLQNLATTNPNAQINIITGSTIFGSGAVASLNQGNVYITIGGAPPSFTPADGQIPAGNPTILETVGGQVTFGSTTNLNGSITADPTAILKALGRNLVFNTTAAYNATHINVGANVTITADPPPITAMSFTSNEGNSREAKVSTTSTSLVNFMPGSVIDSTNTRARGVTTSSQPQTADVINAINAPVNMLNLDNAQLSSFQNATLATANTNSAGLLSGIVSEGDTGSTLVSQSFVAGESQSIGMNTVLQGEVSNGVQHRTLERGPLLLAPQTDVVVDTPHGSIAVAAKSLVLMISSEDSLAVYNMHDVHKNAVTVTHDGNSINVAPGTTALLDKSSKTFEELNPAQFVRYRQPACKAVNKATKLYRAEFELFSMLQGLPAFKELLASEDAETRKTMRGVLKTAAILMQLGAGKENYKFFIKPAVTAYTK
ncbi:MAG: hypothetical protein K2X93_24470 [Candidatus Obscuribacterales bacterium]|nr:hypothetical protein [Candidatus Obscuribacterales bacterium]